MKNILIILLLCFASCRKAASVHPANSCVDRCPYLGEWIWTDSIVHNVTIRQSPDSNVVDILISYSPTWIHATAVVSWQELYVLGQYLYADSMVNEINNGYVWFENKDTSRLHIKIERQYWNYYLHPNEMIESVWVVCWRK